MEFTIRNKKSNKIKVLKLNSPTNLIKLGKNDVLVGNLGLIYVELDIENVSSLTAKDATVRLLTALVDEARSNNLHLINSTDFIFQYSNNTDWSDCTSYSNEQDKTYLDKVKDKRLSRINPEEKPDVKLVKVEPLTF